MILLFLYIFCSIFVTNQKQNTAKKNKKNVRGPYGLTIAYHRQCRTEDDKSHHQPLLQTLPVTSAWPFHPQCYIQSTFNTSPLGTRNVKFLKRRTQISFGNHLKIGTAS